MLTFVAVWFLVSLIVSPIIGKCMAYGLGTDLEGNSTR